MRDTIVESAKVWLTNMITIGVVTLSNIEACLKVLLLLLSVGYTAWKWNSEANKKNKE